MTLHAEDELWLSAWAKRAGRPAPTTDDMEAFAERVAIMPEGRDDAQGVAVARSQAAMEWEGRHGRG